MTPAIASSPADPVTLWAAVLSKLAAKTGPPALDTWFRPVTCSGWDATALRLTVPNETFRRSLLDHYGEVLRQTAAEVAGTALDVVIAVPATEPATDTLPVVQAAALQQGPPGCRWLIDRLWLDQAVGFLGSPPKHLKSWMAMEMAVSVASGEPCLGTFPVPAPGPVLLYAAEDSSAAVRQRLESLAFHHRVELGQLPLWVITADSLRLDRPDDCEKLQATVLRYQPRLLVLDPLIRLHQQDENASGPMAALLGFFRSLQRKAATAVALIHHTRKGPAATTGYNLRGSSDLYAWTDSFLHLQRRHGRLMLSAEHRAAPSFGPVAIELAQPGDGRAHLILGDDAPATRSGTESDSPSPDALAARILNLLSESSEPATVARLRSALRVRNQRLTQTLRQLLSDGKIARVDHAYSLAPPS